ncbi:MAG: hypothetical protein HFI31_07705 [Lachnospiraceae bacterium]|nr:hypothetical protein [Lachnospiraceae bacterium]MCI9134055.1 hypothetical protein [Lachnospiraceae bacterium]
MRAYDESYLDEVVETQGELFENVAEYAPGIDVENFIEEYMAGKTREYIDRAEAYVCTKDAEELWQYFQKADGFCPQKGEGIGGFIPNWVGQFYAYFQWYYNIPSRELIQLLPLDFMIAGYRGLHDLDLELAVKKVGGQCGYEKNNRIS